MNKYSSLLCAGACMAFAGTVQAASIGTDAFQGSVTIAGFSATFDGTAQRPGGCDPFGDASGCDLDGSGPVAATPTFDFLDPAIRLRLDWVDGDSFDVFFSLDNMPGISDASDNGVSDTTLFPPAAFTLTGLDFTEDDGSAAPITGFAFNAAQSEVIEQGFLRSDDNEDGAEFVDPVLGFTPDSIAAAFAFYDPQLFGDEAVLRFDVAAGAAAPGGPSPAPVPLPAGLWLLAGGLACMAGLRRRL